MRKVCCIASLLLVLTGHSIAQPANNIAVVEIYYPAGRTPLGVPTMVAADFRNTGTNDQSNVRVIATITRNNTTVYRDTQYINNWVSGEYRDTSFRDFTPTQKGDYTVCFIAELTSDEVASDNSMCRMLSTRYEADVRAVSVIFPVDTSFRPGTTIRVKARFANQGIRDLFDIRTRVQMKRCSDGAFGFQVDSIPGIPELYFDSTVEFVFPSGKGTQDTRNLLPGCYKVAAISLLGDDVDRTNDTAYSTFTILPFNNNIEADSILTPAKGSRNFPNTAIAPTIRYKNIGNNTQNNVQLSVIIRDTSGQIVYSDQVTANNWVLNESRTITFKTFTPTKLGYYYLQAFSKLLSDEWRNDDTLKFTLHIEGRRNAKVVLIADPPPDGKKHPGGFSPKVVVNAELRSTPQYINVPLLISIYRCADNVRVIVMDTTISVLPADAKDMTIVFPIKKPYNDISSLGVGCYRIVAEIQLPFDEIDTDNTREQTFVIVDTSILTNVGVTAVLDPPPASVALPVANPVTIRVRFTNLGFTEQSSIPVGVLIRHQSGEVVYEDSSVITHLNCMEYSDVQFDNFTLDADPYLGWYTVLAVTRNRGDEIVNDDTLITTFARGFPYDVRVLSMVTPAPNDSIPEKTVLNPEALLDWIGTTSPGHNISTFVEIRDCAGGNLVYSSHNLVPTLHPFGGTVVGLANSAWTRWNTDGVPHGCYTASVKAAYDPVNNSWFDENYGDNEASATFYIVPPSGVAHESIQERISLYQNYPNPSSTSTTISYALPENGRVQIRLLDQLGRVVKMIVRDLHQISGSHSITISTGDLAQGTYWYELIFAGSSGELHRLSKALSALKR